MKTIEGKTVKLWVEPSMKISSVMERIATKMNAIRCKARLSCNSKSMSDNTCISDYNIQSGSTLWEDGRLRGGGDDEETGDGQTYIDLADITDEDLMQEVISRGIMEKLMTTWTPCTVVIPDIASKNVS